MSTEMERNPKPSSNMLTYRQLFTTSHPRRIQVVAAAGRLGLVLGKTLESPVLQAWAENLDRYPAELLIGAFERVEREVAAFPAVSHVVQILDRAEFDEAFAVVLRGLPRHGVKWEDREAWQDPGRYDFSGADRVWIEGPKHPAEPAPELPARMVKALALFGGAASVESGLLRLKRDSPAFWTGETEHNPGDHGRIASTIDRDLFECWKRAQ